jgi:hypothetical protein
MLKNICKLAELFLVLVIMNAGALAQETAPETQPDWLHNQGHNFWIKKPLGWERAEKGLEGDLVEELVSPKHDAFVEVYAAKLAEYMSSEMLANSWEESTRKQLKSPQKRISSEQVNIEGGSGGILRLYQSDRKENVLKTYTLYICQNGKTYVVVGIFPQQMASGYEAAVKEMVLSFRLIAPAIKEK